MTSNQPLSYPTWECVLRYLSVAQRLVLSKRCKALNKLNNRTPLKLQSVQVTEQGISINNNELNYQLGVITIYPNHTPFEVQLANNNGGQTEDVGRFGNYYDNKKINDARIKELEEEIQRQQGIMKIQLSYEQTEWAKRFLRAFENKIVRLRAQIEEIRKTIYISPYSYYLQVITSSQLGERVERVEYVKTLSKTRRHLLRKLLPKTMAIQVDTLELHDPWLIVRRSIRRLVYPSYASVDQLNGKEKELHFDKVVRPERVVRGLMNSSVMSEKHVTVGLVDRIRGDAVMEIIRTLPGAQMSKTPGHVTIPTVNQFKITLYYEEKRHYLHAIVQRN